MSIDTLLQVPGATRERVQRIVSGYSEPLDEVWCCPWKLLECPDTWQKIVLSDPRSNWLLNCSRQSGKTTVVAAQTLWEAMCCGSFVLVVSASERQAYEFMRRVQERYHDLPLVELEHSSMSEMELVNGGRILALPNNEATVRVYSSVDRLVIDEASRVPDTLFGAVRPMLAVSKGRTTLLSTPFGKRGFFYKEWTEGATWRKLQVSWNQCPRIPAAFIEEERRMHGDVWVDQEYGCQFLDVVSGVFNIDAFAACIGAESIGAW